VNRHISVRYRLQRSDFSLDVDADIPMRGITGVFGESGAGKTALLRCIAGLEQGASGRLVIADEVWQDDKISRPVHDREIGYVFQEPRLFAHLNVRQNIEYGQRRGPKPWNCSVFAICWIAALIRYRAAKRSAWRLPGRCCGRPASC
jgi:molybdate transport system ATP-binding protein